MKRRQRIRLPLTLLELVASPAFVQDIKIIFLWTVKSKIADLSITLTPNMLKQAVDVFKSSARDGINASMHPDFLRP